MTTETPLQPLRLMLDRADVRGSARVRLAAAVVAGAASAWLIWVEQSIVLRLLALAGAAFAVRWIIGYRKTGRSLSAADAHYLEITKDRLTVADGTHPRSIPATQIERIELDEDRLVVVLRLEGGEELPIEPVYGGLGLRDLAETLQQYVSARAGAGCTEPDQ